MQISEKLYYYPWQGRANNCNTYIYRGSKTVLFDPGHIRNELNEPCLETLQEKMAAEGNAIADVDLILCTHGHPDHTESVGTVREMSGAKFAIHEDDEFILKMIAQQHFSQTGKKIASLRPDFFLKEGPLVIDEEGFERLAEEIEVLHTPGHSPGCVCFYLTGEKALVSGDTVFQNSIGRADLPGGEMEELEKSLARLAEMDNIDILLPGHMGIVEGEGEVRENFSRIKRYFFG